MLAILLIVFRESLEAALLVGLLAARCSGMPGLSRALVAGTALGLAGAGLMAGALSAAGHWLGDDGANLLNAAILVAAIVLLALHTRNPSRPGHTDNRDSLWVITILVAVAVLREGSEVVLFAGGLLQETGRAPALDLIACVAGALAGAALGAAVTQGVRRLPLSSVFRLTHLWLCLLAGSLGSQLARLTLQSGWLEEGGSPAWQLGGLWSTGSWPGQILHALTGFEARPAWLQVIFYGATVTALIVMALWRVQPAGRSPRLQAFAR